MKTADVTLSVVILTVFFLLFFSTILMTGVSEIKESWGEYRCNPMVMPFAPVFGHDPVENFNHCASVSQGNKLKDIMQPFSADMAASNTTNQENRKASRKAASKQQGFMQVISVIGNKLEAVANNISVETTRTALVSNNVLRKMAGVMQIMTNTTSGVTVTGKSINNMVQNVYDKFP